jgi:hypothetical protein
MRKFQYLTNCVGSDGPSITAMQEQSREVTRKTFQRHVEGLSEIEQRFGYFQHPSQGLTMKNDWHVRYYKSVYRGRPCYYFDHSRIEYIFVQ